MLRLLVLALVPGLVADLGRAQRRGKSKQDVCPWCHEDPELMAAAGVVSHGPFPIAGGSTDDLVAKIPATRWVFLETEHLRWAASIGPSNVRARDNDRVLAELARLREVLPDVPKKARKLDDWLRLHLFAMRGEEFYARFQDLLAVTDDDFPESRQPTGPYMGNGRFLGEKDKYEVVLHANRSAHMLFTESFAGVRVPDSLRWHFVPQHKLLASIPAEDADLRDDHGLFPHVVHNLSHLFFAGYKHFSYDPPIWLDEGLASCMEKEINPFSITLEGEEGSKRDSKGSADWFAAARGLARKDDGPSTAQLMRFKDFGSMDRDANVAAWSRVRFLIDEHPATLAVLLGRVKGQLDEAGYPTGRDLEGLQRRNLKDLFGWSPAQLDQAWAAWAVEQESD